MFWKRRIWGYLYVYFSEKSLFLIYMAQFWFFPMPLTTTPSYVHLFLISTHLGILPCTYILDNSSLFTLNTLSWGFSFISGVELLFIFYKNSYTSNPHYKGNWKWSILLYDILQYGNSSHFYLHLSKKYFTYPLFDSSVNWFREDGEPQNSFHHYGWPPNIYYTKLLSEVYHNHMVMAILVFI